MSFSSLSGHGQAHTLLKDEGCDKLNRLINMTKQQERRYRGFLYCLLFIAVIALTCAIYYMYWDKIPSTIKIRAGVEQELDFKVPVSGEIYKVKEEAAQVSSVAETVRTKEDEQAAESMSGAVESIHVDLHIK